MNGNRRSPPGRLASSASSLGSVSFGAEEFLPDEPWRSEGLAIVVIGASGDLAKKKTYPSLLELYCDGLLPESAIIWGYARTRMTHRELRSRLKPYLVKGDSTPEALVEAFLEICFYSYGKSYGDIDAYEQVVQYVSEHERSLVDVAKHNRLFYLAIPPNVFGETGMAIKKTAMQHPDKGWSRLVVEKPFGRDLASCQALSRILGENFDEHHLYRIDHYLGKEVVQNMLVLRFGNAWLEWMWNRNAVNAVHICFKENFGTQGRGGYFDASGIIRDILQNHLLQVLTLVAMEPPVSIEGPGAGDFIRDAKVHVLNAMPTLELKDCLLGQYDGYKDDPTITNKDTNTPTYAAIRCKVQTPRWEGVPFILEAGKALDERMCEVRIQFHLPPGAMLDGELPRNELVMRLQPDAAIYMRTNVKTPGFASRPTPVSLGMEYKTQFDASTHSSAPDAYTRLLLDVLRGRQGSFVRSDELEKSWAIFTPLLHTIEREQVRPKPYEQGMSGPAERTGFLRSMGAFVDTSEDSVDSSLLERSVVQQSAL